MKVGQLLIIGFDGTETTPELRAFIREEGIGGIILFRRNIQSRGQTRRLVDRLRDEVAGDLPLIVSIDQEGGSVQRLPESFGKFPSMGEIGKEAREKDEPGVAYTAAERIARVLKPMGVNLDFAPVLDVATNPFNPVIGDRSFGHDPDFVAELGLQFMRGLMGGGIGACGKHFPGHGDTDTDSHLELPMMPHTRKRLEACEWKPFRVAIEAGVPSIMTAHLMVPNLDPKYPASISHYITTRILKQEMGFGGVVISDDLNMEGIAGTMTAGESAVRAVQAGADCVLICEDMERQRQAIDALKRAVDEGAITEDHLSNSLTRITNFKKTVI